MATFQTRTGVRRTAGTDQFRPYTVDFPALSDWIEQNAVRYRPVLTAQQILDVGQAGQIKAGRILTAADFTAMGLSAPLGLWNLSDLTDASGNGRALTNKGAVPFGPGITGAATEAAVFAGSTAQALYIADTGAAECMAGAAVRAVATLTGALDRTMSALDPYLMQIALERR